MQARGKGITGYCGKINDRTFGAQRRSANTTRIRDDMIPDHSSRIKTSFLSSVYEHGDSQC